MRLSLNKSSLNKLISLIERKYQNISAAEYLEKFIKESRYLKEEDIIQSFIDYFELDIKDKETKEFIDEYISSSIKEESISTYQTNPYLKNIKPQEVKLNGYHLYMDHYEPFECFAVNDISIEGKDYKEQSHIGYFKETFPFLALDKDNVTWMSVTPNEINTMEPYINSAKGNVLVFGLGIGYYLYMINLKKEVKHITVIEKDQTIIKLFNEYILPFFDMKDKITIINDDAFHYLKENKINQYDYVFVDIYHNAEDGLSLYLNFKHYENGKAFHYWLIESLLAYLRRIILLVIEEYLNEYDDSDYDNPKNNYERLITRIYRYLQNQLFVSYEDIYNYLDNKHLKTLIIK